MFEYAPAFKNTTLPRPCTESITMHHRLCPCTHRRLSCRCTARGRIKQPTCFCAMCKLTVTRHYQAQGVGRIATSIVYRNQRRQQVSALLRQIHHTNIRALTRHLWASIPLTARPTAQLSRRSSALAPASRSALRRPLPSPSPSPIKSRPGSSNLLLLTARARLLLPAFNQTHSHCHDHCFQSSLRHASLCVCARRDGEGKGGG